MKPHKKLQLAVLIVSVYSLTLLLIFAVYSLTLLPINGLAKSTGYVYEIDPVEGLNLRTQDCSRIKTLKQKTFLADAGDNFNELKARICNIGDVNYEMVPVYNKSIVYQGFGEGSYYLVAKKYLKAIGKIIRSETGKVTVDSAEGLNLRDKNCKKVGAVKNNDTLEKDATKLEIVCNVNGNTYDMIALKNDKYVASYFIK